MAKIQPTLQAHWAKVKQMKKDKIVDIISGVVIILFVTYIAIHLIVYAM